MIIINITSSNNLECFTFPVFWLVVTPTASSPSPAVSEYLPLMMEYSVML